MIGERLNSIKNDIKKLDDVSGFKKIVSEHAKINKDIQECLSMINDLTEIVNSAQNMNAINNHNYEYKKELKENEAIDDQDDDLFINIVPDNLDLNDDQYNEYLSYVKNACDTFDQNHNVEDQIQIYLDIMNRINAMSAYLAKRKLETVVIN